MTIDLEELKPWIGRSQVAADTVTPRLVEEYRATFAPHLAPVPAGQAPLAIHWCLSPPAPPAAELGPDGHEAKGGFLPPVRLPRRMWAGGVVETRAPLLVGEEVRRTSTVADVSAKEGRSGPLCFVAVRHELTCGGTPAISERHDIVYRDVPSAGAAAEPTRPAAARSRAAEADLVWEVEAGPTLLFRYSAITFNGHRIHYDVPYVTGVEGYPGLVVHGPLQSSLMFNLAAVLAGATPATFTYRGLTPLFSGEVFRVLGRRAPDGSVECWTENAAGATCMAARSV